MAPGVFDPLEGLDDCREEAKAWLHREMQLKNATEEDFDLLNADRDRASALADFYFAHPELRGWRRLLCAEIVVASAIDLIEPEFVDGYEPASDDVAEHLLRRLLADPTTRYGLISATRPEMRYAGFYPRLAELVARHSPVAQRHGPPAETPCPQCAKSFARARVQGGVYCNHCGHLEAAFPP